MPDTKEMKPLVAIRCITYNHEPYIRDALEGFVMQKTNFPFVAIVHDDASTDGTAAIIREYAEKYPDIIKPIYEAENQYSKQDGSIGRILNAAIEETGAKYIAMCEGDDYWIDPLKLQKQVDFLESHPDYSMCFHGAMIKNETSRFFEYPKVENREYSSNELFENWIVPTASIVYRAAYKVIRDSRFINGDIIVVLSMARQGKVYGMESAMSTYRVQPNGLTIARLHNAILYYTNEESHYKAISENFIYVSKKSINIKRCDTNINLGIELLRIHKLSGFAKIMKGLFLSPNRFVQRLNNLISK